MLIDKVLDALDVPDPEDTKGNAIRGSRLGRCARQSAYMMWPNQFTAAPLPARSRLVFRFGDMIHDLVRQQFRRVIPGQWGMEEERFYFQVPVQGLVKAAAIRKIKQGQLVGVIQGGAPKADVQGHLRGVVLDAVGNVLYVPVHPDGVADLGGQWGLGTVEIKSMATGSFRKALLGSVDYSYRVQMAAEVDAAGLDNHVYVAVRKDTCHLLEVVYSKRATTVSVRFTKTSRMVELVKAAVAKADADDDGDTQTDAEKLGELWEAAEVQHPFEPELLEEARARVRRILMAEPGQLPDREYGPSFVCATCDGAGTQTKTKNGGVLLKKGPKPCKDCGQTGTLAEAELPWQCTYCPFVGECWKGRYRLEIDERPHFIVKQAEIVKAA